MGHRALVAYERTDGNYNLHYSHWGGCDLRLKHTITKATPFGGECPTEQTHQAFDAMVSGNDVNDVLSKYGHSGSAGVALEPRAVSVTIDAAISEWLDFLQHEAFYVVDRAFEVSAYRTLWFGLCYESEVIQDSAFVGNGALRTVRWYQGESVGDGYTRGEFSGVKQTVAEMVDRGVLTPADALDYLEQAVRDATCPHGEVRIVRSTED